MKTIGKSRLAPLLSPSTLETVALQHFDASDAIVKTFKTDRREKAEGFKRDLLTYYMNKGHCRKVIIKQQKFEENYSK